MSPNEGNRYMSYSLVHNCQGVRVGWRSGDIVHRIQSVDDSTIVTALSAPWDGLVQSPMILSIDFFPYVSVLVYVQFN